MHRSILALAPLLFSIPALAQEWEEYVNPRFGTALVIPPGYIVEMESDDGDGKLFVSPDRDESLLVWGSNLSGDSFQQHYENQIADDEALGWEITYSARGDGWRVYSGKKSDRILYSKLLAACKGTQAQHFKFEYSASKKEVLAPVVEKLTSSLRTRKALDC
jgi:hypothetical protein